jgi:hypothetical protein
VARGIPLFYGRVFGSYVINLAVGQRARIDFVNLGNCVAPAGSIINIPGEAANNVHLRCDGPAFVQYSVNAPNINEMIGGTVNNVTARELKWPDTIIKSVNLLCLPTGDSLFTNVAIDVQK